MNSRDPAWSRNNHILFGMLDKKRGKTDFPVSAFPVIKKLVRLFPMIGKQNAAHH